MKFVVKEVCTLQSADGDFDLGSLLSVGEDHPSQSFTFIYDQLGTLCLLTGQTKQLEWMVSLSYSIIPANLVKVSPSVSKRLHYIVSFFCQDKNCKTTFFTVVGRLLPGWKSCPLHHEFMNSPCELVSLINHDSKFISVSFFGN